MIWHHCDTKGHKNVAFLLGSQDQFGFSQVNSSFKTSSQIKRDSQITIFVICVCSNPNFGTASKGGQKPPLRSVVCKALKNLQLSNSLRIHHWAINHDLTKRWHHSLLIRDAVLLMTYVLVSIPACFATYCHAEQIVVTWHQTGKQEYTDRDLMLEVCGLLAVIEKNWPSHCCKAIIW